VSTLATMLAARLRVAVLSAERLLEMVVAAAKLRGDDASFGPPGADIVDAADQLGTRSSAGSTLGGGRGGGGARDGTPSVCYPPAKPLPSSLAVGASSSSRASPIPGFDSAGLHNTHSTVLGVSCAELDAVAAHLFRGRSVPVEKCQELLGSHILHEYLVHHRGYVVDDDTQSPSSATAPHLAGQATQQQHQHQHQHHQQQQSPHGLQRRGLVQLSADGVAGVLSTLVHHDVHLDMVDSEELSHRRRCA
jgi:hypothetical protein